MSRKSHTHKYYRAQLSFGIVWACALPDCNHHMPEHYASLMNGKRSICWDCGAPMIMTPVQLEMDRPICMNCKLGIDDVTDLPMTDALQDYLTKQNKKVS